MPRLQTAGTHSCSQIAIGDFKTYLPTGNFIQANKEYLESGRSYEDDANCSKDGMTVEDFRDDILLPTAQELGRTKAYPFDQLMDLIDNSDLKGKYITVNLPGFQKNAEDMYIHKRLLERGFEEIDQTHNNWGEVCYIYVRNLNREGTKY